MRRGRMTAVLLALALLLSILPMASAATGPYAEHEHEWREADRTEPTCTREGSVTYACYCGETKTEALPKAGHDYGGWRTTREPTCTRAGEKVRVCGVCGYEDERDIDKLPHEWGDWEVVEEPTDHSAGTRAHVCGVCGARETEDYDPEGTLRRGATGDEVKALQENLICYGALERGGADGVFGRGTERAVMQVQEAEGLTADGVAWPQTQSRLGHDFDEWKTVAELTRTTDGVREHTCLRCGLVERDVVEALPKLRRGDRGKPVEFIQQVVTDLGYKPGRIDGIYGPKLEQVIEQWARDHEWYYEPGLLKPIDIDRIIGGWMELLPEEDWIGISGEDTPVRLKLTLKRAWDMMYVYPGSSMAYEYTVTNMGTEDCTLGPLFISYSEDGGHKDSETRYRFVGDISGNELKAGGANSITGKLTITADRDRTVWEKGHGLGDIGYLYVNVWALGTSKVTNKRWYSNTDSDMAFVFSSRGNVDEGLELSGRVLNEKPWYRLGDELEYEVTLTNKTGKDLKKVYYETIASDADAAWTIGEDEFDSMKAGGVWTRTFTHTMEPNDFLVNEEDYHFWLEATAVTPEDEILYAPQAPLCVKLNQNMTRLALTVTQVSPKQKTYAAGDKVTFRWTLTNLGWNDLTLKFLAVDARTEQSEMICTDPVRLLSQGREPLSDTYTITLDEDWIYDGQQAPYHGCWWLEFTASALPYSEEVSTEGADAVYAVPVDFYLPSEALGDGFVLSVEPTSWADAAYAVGDEIDFAWTAINFGPEDLMLDLVDVSAWGDQGMPVYEKRVLLPAEGRGSVSDTCTVELPEEWQYEGPDRAREGKWWFFFQAFGEKAGEEARSNTVEFTFENSDYVPDLVLTLEQTSPVKAKYAAGDEVAFAWTLTNTGDEDLILDHVFADWCDEAIDSLCDGPVLLQAGGGNTLSDTWTCTLEKGMTVDDAWNINFYGRAYAEGEKGQENYAVSNTIHVELTPDFGA